MSKVPLCYFFRSRVRGIFVDSFLIWIKFGKTMQKVVALIATTFKPLLSVAKTNGRLSGRKLHAANVYHLFGNNLTHTFTSSAYKKCAPWRNAPKKCIPLIVATQMPNRWRYEEREKTLFTKVFSLHRINICNLCSVYIVPHFCRFVNSLIIWQQYCQENWQVK